MLGIHEAALRELRLKYNVAYSASQSCARSLWEARWSGTSPSAELLDHDAKALGELTKARGNLLAAIAEAH